MPSRAASVHCAAHRSPRSTRRWSIGWLDGGDPHRLNPPMIGGFDQGIDTFLADGGETRETNWTMDFVRAVR